MQKIYSMSIWVYSLQYTQASTDKMVVYSRHVLSEWMTAMTRSNILAENESNF